MTRSFCNEYWTVEDGKLVTKMDLAKLERMILACSGSGCYTEQYKDRNTGEMSDICTLYLPTDPVVCPYMKGLVEILKPTKFGESVIHEPVYMFCCERLKDYRRGR